MVRIGRSRGKWMLLWRNLLILWCFSIYDILRFFGVPNIKAITIQGLIQGLRIWSNSEFILKFTSRPSPSCHDLGPHHWFSVTTIPHPPSKILDQPLLLLQDCDCSFCMIVYLFFHSASPSFLLCCKPSGGYPASNVWPAQEDSNNSRRIVFSVFSYMSKTMHAQQEPMHTCTHTRILFMLSVFS